MFRLIREFYALLTAEQKRRLKRLQVLVVLMAFAEVTGVVLIGPFMSIATNADQIQSRRIIGAIYRLGGFGSTNEFLLYLGLGVLGVLILSAAFSIFTVWRLFIYGSRVGAEISQRLYNHYLYQSWLFHAGGSSSNLTKQVAQESNRLTDSILIPLMQLNAKLSLAVVMVGAIVFYNPIVAFVGVLIFALAYIALYFTVRRRLIHNGKLISSAAYRRFRLMAEGFGGIKDVLVLGRQQVFVERFKAASHEFAYAKGSTQALGQAPRYFIETIAYGSVILLVLYLITVYDGNAGAILPVLSFYALVGFKMLPALQASYQAISKIRSNLAAFEAVREDLQQSRETLDFSYESKANDQDKLPVQKTVALDEVTFTYPGKDVPTLRNVTIEVPRNTAVGLVGATGSGKSTAIDLFLALLEPQQGALKVDDVVVDVRSRREWQNNVGYVPQDIFLADASIRENIAFGIAPEDIDDKKVRDAAHLAHLEELLEQLSDGFDTRVGERGVQLSGGQKQRIGIARALYDDAEVLVFDEATSALDGITEKRIMDAIYEFAGTKTILMIAHRLSTVRRCDRIYLLERGRVMDQGSYDELRESSETFRHMAAHSQ